MSAKVLTLTGVEVAGVSTEPSVRDVLAGLLAEIDRGEIVAEQCVVLVTTRCDNPGMLGYCDYSAGCSIAESHTLFSVGARLKMGLLFGDAG